MQTTINAADGKILILGPFSAKNNEIWRSLGGKFSGGGSWVFPDTEGARLRVVELFGAKSDEVVAIIPLALAAVRENGGCMSIGGYVLATRRGRDYSVQTADGVTLEAGSFPSSGGSVKHPRVAASTDAVFALRCRSSFATAHGLEIQSTKAVSSIEI